MTVVITVTDGQKMAEHAVYNQSAPWSEEQAREWVSRNEYDPWRFVSVRVEE